MLESAMRLTFSSSLHLAWSCVALVGCGDEVTTVGLPTTSETPGTSESETAATSADDQADGGVSNGGAASSDAGVGSEVGDASNAEGEQVPAADANAGVAPAVDGETFFLGTCAPCHGPLGQGVEGVAPDIAHPVREYSTWVVRNGRESTLYPTAMMAFDETILPAEQLEQVLDFLEGQPQPVTGEALFKDYCAACHSADASGGPSGTPLGGETDDIEDQVREGNDPGAYAERDKFMPSWSTGELSDDELQLIAQYVDSL